MATASKKLALSRSLPRLWRKDYAYLFALLCVFAPLYLALFRTHMLQPGADGGLYSGGSAWYDMGLHAAISTSFVYGANFPPIYTALPPEPLLYPFLPDFQTSLLIVLGLDLHMALVSTATPLALALTGIFYLFALRLLRLTTGDAGRPHPSAERRPRAAALATVLFLFNGGLGFIYFFRDWRASGKGFAEFWSRMEANYANMGGEGIVWTNIITDTLLPQRTSLFGLPLALIVFTLFAIAWHEADRRETKGTWGEWRLLVAAGVLAGLLPAFHVHSYVAIGLVSVFLFLVRPRRVWLAFWLPAVLLALPHFTGLLGHVASTGFVRFQPGWSGHNEPVWLLFWLRNVGLPTLLIIPAWIYAPRPMRFFYVAFVALLAFSLLVIISPNSYDNIKLIYYWNATTCVLIAAWLVRLASTRRWLVPAMLLAFTSIVSGALALRHELQNRKLIYSREELATVERVRAGTAPRSLFLTGPNIHQPVLSLAGRAIVRGDTAWLWSHGYPFAEREADVRAIYAGREDALDLLRYYRVDYIYLGPRERQELKANQPFFDRVLPAFYRGEGITIYDARGLAPPNAGTAPGDPRRLLAPYSPREYASRLDLDPFQPMVEFRDIGYPLYRQLTGMLGRPPRYEEFMSNLKTVGRGVYPGQAGWRGVVDANRRELAGSWKEQPDHDTKPDKQSARDYNAAYVLLHYFGYLRRDPDGPPDHDLAGYNFWLRDLDRTGDYRSLTRVFIESGEYKDRKQ